MPSRWASTGTRASAWTRATRLLPPRGTITSIVPSSRQHGPTAARSCVGTSWTARRAPAAARPRARQARMRGSMTASVRRAADRVAGPQAERPGVGGDVRPALIDDADHPEGHAHPLDRQAVRPRLRRSPRRPDRAGRDLVDGVGDRGNPLAGGASGDPPGLRWRPSPWSCRQRPWRSSAARMTISLSRMAAAIPASA